MALGWFIAPYKWYTINGKDIRYCAMGDFTKDIQADDGDWTEAEIDGDKAIVLVRASTTTLTRIGKGSDVAITSIEDPKPYWKPMRISPINGVEYENRTLEDINAYFFDDQGWGNFKALAETIASEYNTKQSYVKIAKGEWRVTAQLLVLLGKAGYKLDKISTGTFPTLGVLDNFDRANATTVGAGWTLCYTYGGAGDWGISSNQLYSPETDTWAVYYFNASTYGPDTECYMTLATTAGDWTDSMNLFVRVQSPGSNFDGYDVNYYFAQTGGGNHDWWTIEEITDHVTTAMGAGVEDRITNGDKMGIEIIGRVITAYKYESAAWSAVLTRTDVASPYYDDAGYVAAYIPANTTARYDDFGGGTIVAAGGVPIARYKKYYDYRRAQ